jgi:hypothetical protein
MPALTVSLATLGIYRTLIGMRSQYRFMEPYGPLTWTTGHG